MGGRVVTLMPNTWKESNAFKEKLRTKKKAKKFIMRRLIPDSRNKYESFYCYSGRYYTEKANYPLYWIYSTEKKKRDRLSREKLLQKVDHKLTALLGKINMRNLKTREQILRRIQDILQLYGVSDFYNIEIKDMKEKMITQIGRGRPGKTTKYKTTYETIYSLYWTRDREAINREKNIDGIFPLICTDKEITAKEGLTAYKYQPRLEKRFSQLKTVHNAAPTLFKKVERVEAMMFLFFIALIIQAVIERDIRQKMKDNYIDAIPIYPEHRLAYQPTTTKIFDRFHDTSLYQLIEKNHVVKEYKDDLTDVQRKVLHLLGMSEESYWDVLNF